MGPRLGWIASIVRVPLRLPASEWRGVGVQDAVPGPEWPGLLHLWDYACESPAVTKLHGALQIAHLTVRVKGGMLAGDGVANPIVSGKDQPHATCDRPAPRRIPRN